MDEERPAIVIDNGSFDMRAGFAGEVAPRAVFPTITGRMRPSHRHMHILIGMGHKDVYVGDEAQSKRGILLLSHPIQRGVVTNWNDMEAVWKHLFEAEMRVDSEEHAVMHTETTFNSQQNRERMAQCMFETFNVPAFHVANHALLAMYASGRTTGIAVMSGDELTETVPIVDGHVIKDGARKLEFGGKELLDHLQKSLTEYGYRLTTTAERAIVRDIKEKLTYTSLDYDEELKLMQKNAAFEKNYELPSGQLICVSGENRIKCAEPMFSQHNLDRMVLSSVAQCNCNEEIRAKLLHNIVLSGGNTMFAGFGDRLQSEVQKRIQRKYLVDAYLRTCSSDTSRTIYNDIVNVSYDFCDVVKACRTFTGSEKVKVVAPPERKYSVWVGGSILASLGAFQKSWITKHEYEDAGPSIVHRKIKINQLG